MRRTNKRNKKQNNIKKRKTLKKRFSKKGGNENQTYCNVCNKWFFNVGKPVTSLDKNNPNLYENHIKTHPMCKYCDNKQFLDINGQDRSREYQKPNEYPSLISHLETSHPEEYKLAQSIKYGINNEINLIDKLRNNDWSVIGSPPELKEFYKKIEDKQKSIEQKEADNRLKAEKTEAEEAKKLAKKAEKEKQNLAKKKREEKARLEEEANWLAKEADKERQRVARETAAAEKAEKERLLKEKEQQEKRERLARNLEVNTMGSEDILATEIEIELRRNLIEAKTVEDVEEIIDNASNINESHEPIISKQEPIYINQLITQEDFNNLYFVDFFIAISKMYPAMTVFNTDVSSFIPYKNINYGILFIVGVINNKLNELDINLKLVLKGGKAAQMILTENKIDNKTNKLIKSNDIDILLTQDGIYDYDFLLNFASQLADFFEYFFNTFVNDNVISTIKPPNKILENQNIVKISYKYLDLEVTSNRITRKTGLVVGPNYIPRDFDYTYIPLSDIDFKQVNVDNDFFSSENIVSSTNSWKTKNGYKFNLLYYHQNLPTFIAEKEYYMSIYSNIIQQIPNAKPGNPGCDCSLPNDDNNECKRICRYRDLMLEKFNKYIGPLKKLIV